LWGLTVRASQIRFYGPEHEVKSVDPPVLEKGICAFLDS